MFSLKWKNIRYLITPSNAQGTLRKREPKEHKSWKEGKGLWNLYDMAVAILKAELLITCVVPLQEVEPTNIPSWKGKACEAAELQGTGRLQWHSFLQDIHVPVSPVKLTASPSWTQVEWSRWSI